ncbi:structural maintenance of chromosomes flexible hinge domain-containing protein 1 [Megalops cyprinoides]|uniref:structural maintenance of chromosomes flexible hinge domain-containing protein 1 n=1 Tax=Megalops cyprinoides TaxID=118141 RepID=UPI001864CB8B|nr:structural maintenance of chromosomes flexible hinge domain-containing protein 1 [Megalops cyprinoides]
MADSDCFITSSLDMVQAEPCGTNDAKASAKTAGKVVVFDCRRENSVVSQKVLDIQGMGFTDFLRALSKEFSISSDERFVLTTTDRKEINAGKFAKLKDGSTLHMLHSVDQVLPGSTKERILFLPHYDTLIQSGMYEYYASEGQKSLPYAFAELIDNALSATAKNDGVRTIDIRLLFDESQGKPAVVVVDNGCGMTSKQLNNWAVYRLSKFTRESSEFESNSIDYVRPAPVPRSLNSDISYFGVGGKQAVFYIGQSTRMITKPVGSMDVHELLLSKEEFEKKEKNKQEIYEGFILNRKPGDSSHISSEDERFLHSLISEEIGKDHFTAVVVTGIQPEHIAFLRADFHLWTRELAHVYHYYVHGLQGNDLNSSDRNADTVNIDIQISLLEKLKIPRTINLREINNDMQTLYITSSVDSFEFKVQVEGEGSVEGIIRYHPFLYDKETYPKDPYAIPISPEEEDEDCVIINQDGRGKRPIFECFWNGRLIPYTTVAEFDWCARPKKSGPVPAECYSRISGVLFTNDKFQVSTNKLTFMDLELQLRGKQTIFTRIVNGQEQRVKIQKEFTQWLKGCHEKWDKQVKFSGFKGIMTRTDVATKKLQSPWARFNAIEWDGKTYKAGQYVKSQKTHPILFGTIVQFLLYGDHDGDVHSTGGQVQIAMEPKAVYDEVRTIPISKIDRGATLAAIRKYMDDELAKLPDRLKVTWPEGNEWAQMETRQAGTPFGPIQVEILNKKGESMTRMPGPNHTASKKLLIELKVIWHSPTGDVETNSHVCQHGGKWAYWFKTMENLNKLGKYTLHLQTVMNENNASVCAGEPLPSWKLEFSIREGCPERFMVAAICTPFHVGEPFSISMELFDEFGNPARPPPDLKPVLECSALDISYEDTAAKGTTFIIKGVKAKGPVKSFQGKTYNVKVILPGLKQNSQTLKIILLPGQPHILRVKPDSGEISVENGTAIMFQVEVQDEAGNITTHPKLIVRCRLLGASNLPVEAVDCCNTGTGSLMDKPLYIKNIQTEQTITAKFDIPSLKNIEVVERTLRITPSSRVARLEIFSQEGENVMVLEDKEKIGWTAGDTLEHLHFRLFDEGNRNVPITASLAKKIKVNWRADLYIEDLQKGKLPNVQIANLVKDDHFYQVSFQDENKSVECSFTITPRADEPKRMKATLKCETSVRMGEVLPGQIHLEVVDQYGNKTQALTSACVNSFGVSAEGLDKSQLKISWQESIQVIMVEGVKFHPGKPGSRELCFAWRDFAEYVRVNVIAGPPAQLQLVDGPEEPLQVFNGKDLEKPFIVQLCDAWKNPSPDPRVIISLKPSATALKIKPSPTSQSVDRDGRASFTVCQVTAPKGEYGLEFKGSLNKQSIPGPVVKLKVLPDPNKPVKLVVSYNADAAFPAGGFLTVFSVMVESEDGGAVKNLSPASISMLMWKGESFGPRPPPGASTLKCSKPKDTEKVDCFYFRDKIIPDRVGKYTIQFVFCVEKNQCLWSNQYIINVVPNDPVKLMPDIQPATPVVSNINAIESRFLIRSLPLMIMDEYDNPAGTDMNGKVVVSIKSSNSSQKELPLFQGKTKTMQFTLSKGVALITNLAIMENCPGTDGTEYILHFKPIVPGFKQGKALRPFELPFMFYNDSKNQQQMATLTKEKDRLSLSIVAYRSLFDTNNQLISELKGQLQDAVNREVLLKSEIRKIQINITGLGTMESVEALIKEKMAEQERISQQPRRTCTIPDVFKGNPDVLGKVAHLAQVEDNDAARVISWHLSGDMDCVVTVTTEAARQIYNDTQGRQQVMPLETIFWRSTNRPLPHIRNGLSTFPPVGNPVFVRDLLIFPNHAERCQIVFGNLLGDTILIDDLDSANHYRKGVVQNKMQCPTLLTRQGERIRSNGKFGGLQNKAPSIEKLRGQVFGAPLPKQYYTLCTQIELLQQYCIAKMKYRQVKEDYEIHMQYMKSPDMVQKEKEMKEQEDQLKDIELKLGMTPTSRRDHSGMKRVMQESGEHSEIASKRTRRGDKAPPMDDIASPGRMTRKRVS